MDYKQSSQQKEPEEIATNLKKRFLKAHTRRQRALKDDYKEELLNKPKDLAEIEQYGNILGFAVGGSAGREFTELYAKIRPVYNDPDSLDNQMTASLKPHFGNIRSLKKSLDHINENMAKKVAAERYIVTFFKKHIEAKVSTYIKQADSKQERARRHKLLDIEISEVSGRSSGASTWEPFIEHRENDGYYIKYKGKDKELEMVLDDNYAFIAGYQVGGGHTAALAKMVDGSKYHLSWAKLLLDEIKWIDAPE